MKTLEALFPKVRIQVLRLLLRNADAEIHLRELTRQSGLSLGVVQREMANLHSVEIVSSRRDGNRQYFQANKKHPIYRELRGIFEKCSGAADVLMEELEGTKGIQIAFIFGSVANQHERAESDLDLMIIGRVGLRSIASQLRMAGERLGRVVNPYVLDPQTWVKRLNEGDAFITAVSNGGKIFLKGDEHGIKQLGK